MSWPKISKDHFLFFAKASISLGILYLLSQNITWSNIQENLSSLAPLPLGGSLLLTFVSSLFLMVWKSQRILQAYVSCSFRYLTLVTWASDFVNLFSLGPVGGEAYKMMSFPHKLQALFASGFDKILTFYWYVSLALSLAIPYVLFSDTYHIILGGLSIYLIISSITYGLIFYRKFWISFLPSEILKFAFSEKALPLPLFIKHSLISLLSVLIIALKYILVYQALGISVSMIDMLLFIPILLIGLTLPISIDGLGVREFLFIEFGQYLDINSNISLTASLSIYFLTIIYKLSGSIPFLLHKNFPKKQDDF